MAKITPIPSEVFTAKNQTAMINTINSLWDMQIDTVTQKRVIEALELQGIPNEWMDELTENIDFFLDNQFTPVMSDKVDLAGDLLINQVNDLDLSYTPGNNALSFIDDEIVILGKDLKNPLSRNVTNVLRNSVDNDLTISQTKQMMNSAMTLTERDNIAYLKFKDNLSIDLTKKQRDVLANNYFKKLQRNRSERIARTELTRVKHFGEMDSINQNMSLGRIKGATKIWNRANFKDNWESSIVNDGVEVGINEEFPEPCATGNAFYPSEINEYCYLDYSIE